MFCFGALLINRILDIASAIGVFSRPHGEKNNTISSLIAVSILIATIDKSTREVHLVSPQKGMEKGAGEVFDSLARVTNAFGFYRPSCCIRITKNRLYRKYW